MNHAGLNFFGPIVCLGVSLYTHIVFLLHLYNVLISVRVRTLKITTLSCSTVKRRVLAHIFVLSGNCCPNMHECLLITCEWMDCDPKNFLVQAYQQDYNGLVSIIINQ